MEFLERSELLLGKNNIERLNASHILLVGLGGVGAMTAEMLCRSGIGEISIVDSDIISTTNINRQILATSSSVNRNKVDVMKERLLDINPQIKINTIHEYLEEENRLEEILEQKFDYVVDAIDTLTPKINLINQTIKKNYPLISSLGSGGKIDPSKVQVGPIEKSYNCKLGAMLRKRLHRINIYSGFDVVFSSELVDKSAVILTQEEIHKRSNVGSVACVTNIFGIYCASTVLNNLTSK